MAKSPAGPSIPPSSPGSYQRILDSINEGVGMLDADHRFVYVNQGLCRMLGYTREEMLGQSPVEFLDDENRARFLEERARRSEGADDPYELAIHRKDGAPRRVLVSPTPRFDVDGTYLGSLSVITDVTELKRAEADLARSEAAERTLIDATRDIVFFLDPAGTVLECNEALASSLGVGRADLLGTCIFDHLPAEVAASRREQARLVLETGEPSEFEDSRSGHTFRTAVYPVRDGSGAERYAVYARDITEEKRLADEANRAHKLESLGVMAGGIAHDFNNLLTGIIGNLSLARRVLERDEDPGDLLEEAESAAGRAEDLTQQLLTFARGGEPVRNPVSLLELMRKVPHLVSGKTGVSCEVSCDEPLWLASADARQVGQVVEQLVANAEQAMVRGGTVRVRCSNLDVDEAGLEEAGHVEPGRYVRIDVVDEGMGIQERNLERLFDPFFSTRRDGRGLGLSIAYAIVKKHEGHIWASSPVSGGAVFSVLLPAAEAPAVQDPSRTAMARGSRRVLVMDDEPLVRDFLIKTLGKLGHEAEACSNGEQALTRYAEEMRSGRPFDLVIMDLTVAGGMGGEETIGRLLDMDGEAVAVVSSGYSDSPVMSEHERFGFRGVLAKPYNVDDVIRLLQEMPAARREG